LNQVRAAITSRTKAISWVNYAGTAPDIAGLQRLAKEFNLVLIEDNAHGLGGSYHGKPLGSFGDFATQSFHATKNIQCGEGGALIINNSKYLKRAEIIREKGTDRSQYIRGEIQKYQWVDQGSSYLLAESLAALLLGQLESFREIQNQRESLWNRYSDEFSELNRRSGFQPHPKSDYQNIAHMYYLTFDNMQREAVRLKLKNQGIFANSHYMPLDSSIFASKYLKKSVTSPTAKMFSESILRLPLHLGLNSSDISLISRIIKESTR
jgi:dTDP-4-amino-4,6-dideoxygalactose transaminase